MEGVLEIYDALKYNLHFELYGISSRENYTDCISPWPKQDDLIFYVYKKK
jgi:hypothetical protein